MNSAISVTAITRMAFGREAAQRRLIAVLGAFFDDSGTHEASPVCVIGGLLGTEAQWDAFAEAWSRRLENPLPNKPRLDQFHLTDCLHGKGEFESYNIAERGHVQYLFRKIIIETEVITIAIAVNKKAWHELVVGDLIEELGEPLDLCFFKCMERLIHNGRRYRLGEPISAFFDQGIEKKFRLWSRLYESQKKIYPELDFIGFAPVRKVFPLQGADMIATGTFHYNIEWLKNREDAVPNPHFRDFIKHRYSEGFVFDRDQIAEMVSRARETLVSRKKPS